MKSGGYPNVFQSLHDLEFSSGSGAESLHKDFSVMKILDEVFGG